MWTLSGHFSRALTLLLPIKNGHDRFRFGNPHMVPISSPLELVKFCPLPENSIIFHNRFIQMKGIMGIMNIFSCAIVWLFDLDIDFSVFFDFHLQIVKSILHYRIIKQ